MRGSLISSPSDVAVRAGWRPAFLLLAFWRLSRPAIWLVSVLPFSVGYVLASHRLFFPLNWAGGHRVVLATLAIGPLFWLSALLISDVYDLPGDRLNARKRATPLIRGHLTVSTALVAAAIAAALAVTAAAFVSPSVSVITVVLLASAWLYSSPPARLKERPGADLAVNAGALGGLTLLAGWATVRPLADFPWPMLAQGVLVAAALYVPTTLVDHDADALAGFRTLATRLGPKRACLLGWWSWVAANAGALVLCAANTVIPRDLLPFLLPATACLVAEYAVLIAWPRTGLPVVRGIVITSMTFFAVNAVFAIEYTRR